MSKPTVQITKQDLRHGDGRSAARIAAETILAVEKGQPWCLPLDISMDRHEKNALEERMRQHFQNWARTWVLPELRAIVAKEHRREFREGTETINRRP